MRMNGDNFLNQSLAIDNSSSWRNHENMHCFSHKAMSTIFEIFIEDQNTGHAAAAVEAFKTLDMLEQDLSRFIPNSDITRINKLQAGAETIVNPDTFACLQQSAELFHVTRGAFDISAGLLIDHWRQNNFEKFSFQQPKPEDAANIFRQHFFELDDQRFSIKKMTSQRVELDLGGIGKGYAIDKMVALLQDWGVETFFVHGGQSSIYGFSAPTFSPQGWPVTLSLPDNENAAIAKITLKNRSISGSGLQRGSHIFDPRINRPATRQTASWAGAPDATTADALSTAFMVLDSETIDELCRTEPGLGALIISNSTRLSPQFYGELRGLTAVKG